jgi:hypothetical protein
MAEGLGKSAGACITCGTNGRCFCLLAVPAHVVEFPQFGRSNKHPTYSPLPGAVRVLTEGTVNHLQVYPVLGRNSAPYDAVRGVLSHLMVQDGVTDAAVVETRLAAADGRTYDADVVYFDPSSMARVILEVSIVTIGSGTSLGRGAQAGLDGVNAQLRAREEEKRNHDVVRRLFSPPSSCQPVEQWGPQWWPFSKKSTAERSSLTSSSCHSSQKVKSNSRH